MALPKNEKGATRAAILQAAAELVQAEGISGLTIERVIRKAGISKGGFFYHFATKEALVEELVRGKLDAFEARIQAGEAHGLTFPQALFEALFEEVETNAPMMASVNAAVEFGNGEGFVEVALQRRDGWIRKLFEALDPQRAQLAALALDGLLYQSTLRRRQRPPAELQAMAAAIGNLVFPARQPDDE